MIILFISTLFLTFAIVRILAHRFHDVKNYGTKREKSKTLTGYLRVKTGYDWHHFHFGILILLIVLPLLAVHGLTNFLVIFLAMGISMIIDQSTPIVDKRIGYFHIKNLLVSFIFHVLVSLMAIFILY